MTRGPQRIASWLAIGAVLLGARPAAAACTREDRDYVEVRFLGPGFNPKLARTILADLDAGLDQRGLDACDFRDSRGEAIATVELIASSSIAAWIGIDARGVAKKKELVREMQLDRVPSDGRAFAIAVAVDELVRAAFTELALTKRAWVRPERDDIRSAYKDANEIRSGARDANEARSRSANSAAGANEIRSDGTSGRGANELRSGSNNANEIPSGSRDASSGSNDTNEIPSGARDANEVRSGSNDANEVRSGSNDANEVRSGSNDANEVRSGSTDANEVLSDVGDRNKIRGGSNKTNEVPSGARAAKELRSGSNDANEIPSGSNDANEIRSAGETNELRSAADDLNETPSARVGRSSVFAGARGAIEAFGGGETQLGAELFARARVVGPIVAELAGGVRQSGRTVASSGTIEARALSAAFLLGLTLIPASEGLELAVEAGVRGAWIEFRGRATAPGASAAASAGLALYARGGVRATLPLWRGLGLEARAGAGGPLRSLDARDGSNTVTGASGLELYGSTGISWGF